MRLMVLITSLLLTACAGNIINADKTDDNLIKLRLQSNRDNTSFYIDTKLAGFSPEGELILTVNPNEPHTFAAVADGFKPVGPFHYTKNTYKEINNIIKFSFTHSDRID